MASSHNSFAFLLSNFMLKLSVFLLWRHVMNSLSSDTMTDSTNSFCLWRFQDFSGQILLFTLWWRFCEWNTNGEEQAALYGHFRGRCTGVQFYRCTNRTRGIPVRRCMSPSRCLYTLNDFWSVYSRLERPLKTHNCYNTNYSTISTQYRSNKVSELLTVEDLIVSRVGHDEVVVRWPVQVCDIAGMSLWKQPWNSWTHLNTHWLCPLQ